MFPLTGSPSAPTDSDNWALWANLFLPTSPVVFAYMVWSVLTACAKRGIAIEAAEPNMRVTNGPIAPPTALPSSFIAASSTWFPAMTTSFVIPPDSVGVLDGADDMGFGDETTCAPDDEIEPIDIDGALTGPDETGEADGVDGVCTFFASAIAARRSLATDVAYSMNLAS